jgi:hypothetical protein
MTDLGTGEVQSHTRDDHLQHTSHTGMKFSARKPLRRANDTGKRATWFTVHWISSEEDPAEGLMTLRKE